VPGGKARYHCTMREFLFRCWVLLGLCAAPWPAQSHAQVGIVLTVEGEVNVISGKQECGLRYGLDLEEGDTVRTGEKSWAVLSLLDGARITVRPSTEMRVEEYRFIESGDAVLNRATLALARGSLRVLTGAITRGLNSGYRVRTPEVMMELRGTDHDVAHVPPQFTPVGYAVPGSYGKSHAGEAMIKNAGGELSVRDGQTGFSAIRMAGPPRLLTSDPAFFNLHAFIDRRAAAVSNASPAIPNPQ